MKHFILIIILISLTLTGCGRKEAARPEKAQGPEPAAETTTPTAKRTTDPVQHKIMSFSLEGLTDKGAKNWAVKGDSAESISETQVKLNNIEAKSYGQESLAVITADNGIYDKGKNNVRLNKNVRATIENTESGNRELFDFPGTVKDPSKTKKKGDAAAKKTKTVITCDADVLFDYQNNHVYFNKNVKVISDDGTIDADRITVNMDPATRKIVEIIAEGNVKMVRGENVTYSDKATYVEREKTVALTGQPKLVVYQEGGLGGSLFGESGGKDASTGNSRPN